MSLLYKDVKLIRHNYTNVVSYQYAQHCVNRKNIFNKYINI